jgi:hypothetical protein
VDAEDKLVALEQTIRDIRSSRSLLMCYCCHLPFFETALLDALQREGETAVALITDISDYAESFADLTAVSGPGLRYSLSPMQLPGSLAAFHPKLYCFLNASGATLVVASANLTFFGARSNAEVIDVLQLSRSGSGDRAAFASYVELLGSLQSLSPSLSEQGRLAVEAMSKELREMLSHDGEENAEGVQLLHSARVALIDQLRANVPSNIRRITIVSPFFDQGGVALRRLANSYPNARLRVVKGLENGDFNGAAVRSLGNRLAVERLTSISGKARRLHAKLVVLENEESAWVVAGSANMTSAAWLRSAEDDGNLEAITLRRIPRTDSRRLLSVIGSEALNLEDQAFTPVPPPSEQDQQPRIDILCVELHGQQLTLQCRGDGWERTTSTVTVDVESRYARSSSAGQVTVSEMVVVRATIDPSFEQSNSPATVRLSAQIGATTREGRAWLDRPEHLFLSADGRRLYQAREAALNRFSGSADQWDLLASGLAAFVDVLYNRWVNPSSQTGQRDESSSRTAQPPEDRPLASAELLVAEKDVNLNHHTGRRVDTRFFESLLGSVHRLFREEPGSELPILTRAGSNKTDVGADEGDDEGDSSTDGENGETTADRPPLSADAVRAISAQLSQLWDVVTASQPTAEHMQDAVRLLDTTVSGFYLPLLIQLNSVDREQNTAVVEAVRRTWAQMFSVRGALHGTPAGWLIRAWAEPANREIIRHIMEMPERLPRLMTLLAASTAGLDLVVGLESDHTDLLAGFRLVLGTWPPTEAIALGADSSLQQLGEFFPLFLQLGSPVPRLEAMSKSEPETVAAARTWAPFARLLLADDGLRDVTTLEKALGLSSPGLLAAYKTSRRRYRPAAKSAVPQQQGMSCRGCNTRISQRVADRLLRVEFTAIQCESCGLLLLPFDFSSPAVSEFLKSVAPGFFGPDLDTGA